MPSILFWARRVGGAISFRNSIAWAHFSETFLEKGHSVESFLGGAVAKKGAFWERRADGTNSIEIP